MHFYLARDRHNFVPLTWGNSMAIMRSEPMAVDLNSKRVFFHARTSHFDANAPAIRLVSVDLQYSKDFTTQIWTPQGVDVRAVLADDGQAAILTVSAPNAAPSVLGVLFDNPLQQLNPGKNPPGELRSYISSILYPSNTSPCRSLSYCVLEQTVGSLPHISAINALHLPFSLGHAYVWLPNHFSSQRQQCPAAGWPVVLQVYGGPDVAQVVGDWAAARGAGAAVRVASALASGYAVAMIDGRGSFHPQRGSLFEAGFLSKATEGACNEFESEGQRCPGEPLHSKISVSPSALDQDTLSELGLHATTENSFDAPVVGEIELLDQIEGLRALFSAGVPIDLKRVAIMGWSYGK
jgi:hypothetical protein